MDAITYTLCKKYTDQVALGIGNMRVVDNVVYFTVAATGEEKAVTLPVPKDGVSIVRTEISNGHLITHYSDGTTEDSGELPIVGIDEVDTIVEEKVTEQINTQLDETIQEKVDKAVEEALQNNDAPAEDVEDEINSWF